MADALQNAPSPASDASRAAPGLRPYLVVIAVGAFVTLLTHAQNIAYLPTTFLLKEQLGLSREQVALFFFWATFPWNLKPIAGILTDAFPIFGSRRTGYLLLGTVAAASLWLVFGAFPSSYSVLLGALFAVGCATVLASTVVGGLLVEVGQTHRAPGRVAALLQVVRGVTQVAGPSLGGYLATRAFGLTAATAAGLNLLLAGMVWFLLRDRSAAAPVPRVVTAVVVPGVRGRVPALPMIAGTVGVGAFACIAMTFPEIRNIGISLFALAALAGLTILLSVLPTRNQAILAAQRTFELLFASKALWMAAAMLFLVHVVPGLATSLVYRQSDVLKFTPAYIGYLGSVEGAGGIAAALAYTLLCRRLSLRYALIGGVCLQAMATLTYLTYAGSTAPFVHGLVGFTYCLAELALFDLAVRATPRGCEALGFAVMMSIRNLALSMSDVIGTQMMDQFALGFGVMVMINSSTTLLVLGFVPWVPGSLLTPAEGQS